MYARSAWVRATCRARTSLSWSTRIRRWYVPVVALSSSIRKSSHGNDGSKTLTEYNEAIIACMEEGRAAAASKNSAVDTDVADPPSSVSMPISTTKLEETVAARSAADAAAHESASLSSSSSSSSWQQALQLLTDMKALGVTPDGLSYFAAFMALTPFGRWRETLHLMDEMKADNVPIEDFHYSAAIQVMAKGGQWQLARSLLDDMSGAGLFPDLFTYNSVLIALRDGHWEEAMAVLDEMRTKGVSPNEVSYRAVLDTLAKHGRVAEAMTLLNTARQSGGDLEREDDASGSQGGQNRGLTANNDSVSSCGISLFTYNAALNVCGHANARTEAALVWQLLAGDGLVPNRVSYNAYLSALHGCVDEQIELIKEMKEKCETDSSLVPNHITHQLLIRSLVHVGAYDRAEALVNDADWHTKL